MFLYADRKHVQSLPRRTEKSFLVFVLSKEDANQTNLAVTFLSSSYPPTELIWTIFKYPLALLRSENNLKCHLSACQGNVNYRVCY